MSNGINNNGNNGASAKQVSYVDELKCYAVSLLIPSLVEMRQSTDSFSLTRQSNIEQATALVHLVGICHRLNWDFTLGHLASELWKMSNGFAAETLSILSETEFRRAFGNYRRDDGGLNYKRRLDYLRKISGYITTNNLIPSLLASETISGEQGALNKLCQVPVYNDDPLRKKSNALLHELVRRKLIGVKDPENIEPAIDYHIMRLYLRTGRVVVTDPDLEDRLIKRKRARIEAITQLRQTVAEAMRFTAWVSKVSISLLNDIEWAFARRACRRDEAWCSNSNKKCPFDILCPNAFLPVKQMIAEPDSRHGHY